MGVKEVRRELAVRRICESATASVVGGLILWSVTSSMSRPTPSTERMAVTVAPTIQSTAVPTLTPIPTHEGPSLATTMTTEAPAASMAANLPLLASISGPMVAVQPQKVNLLPYSVPVGSIVLYENFSRYREGDATEWGPNTFIKMGLDRRHWLASSVDGTHPVGRNIRLPNTFCFECRYSANISEVTRGILGWWKDPVATKIVFLNDRGVKYAIEWVIGCGNDITRLNPLGSSSLYAKKYYHTTKLPDGTANEVGVVQPTGMMRIERDNNVIKVFIDGQATVVGTISQMGQLVGFEINVVKAKNVTLFFTDFKIAR